MLALVAALAVTQVPDWVERARVTGKQDVVERTADAFCSEKHRARMYGFEVLCAARPVGATTAHWRAPKRDDTWTVRVDVLRFEPAAMPGLIAEFRRLAKSPAGSERVDGGMSPTLSWCQTSYVFRGDTVVVVAVACGANRPWKAVSDALLAEAGPGTIGVIGAEGGRATVVEPK
ncbi:MAG: hypothetical protein U0228_37400 [Myxococcaceae bacterium]